MGNCSHQSAFSMHKKTHLGEKFLCRDCGKALAIINIYQTSNDCFRGRHPRLGSVGEHQQKNGQSGTRWPSGRRSLFAGCMGKAFVITHHRETLHVGTLWSSAQMTFSWLTPQLLERTVLLLAVMHSTLELALSHRELHTPQGLCLFAGVASGPNP